MLYISSFTSSKYCTICLDGGLLSSKPNMTRVLVPIFHLCSGAASGYKLVAKFQRKLRPSFSGAKCRINSAIYVFSFGKVTI